MGVLSKVTRSAANVSRGCAAWAVTRLCRLRNSKAGQGTTEYAILVGVIVLIAIIAIGMFRENLRQLWDAIAQNLNTFEPAKEW